MTEAIRRRRRPQLTDRMIAALERRAAPYFHPDPELGRHGIRVRQEGPGTYTVVIRDIYQKTTLDQDWPHRPNEGRRGPR